MKMPTVAILLFVLAAGGYAAARQARTAVQASPDRAALLRANDEAAAQLAELDKIHARIVALNAELVKLYDQLSRKAAEVGRRADAVRAAKGGAAAGGHGASMASGMGAASGTIGAAAGGSGEDELLKATKEMQETQMSFNLQYLQLQSQMQNENRQYTAVSNILKTKHDTVKNSISNIR